MLKFNLLFFGDTMTLTNNAAGFNQQASENAEIYNRTLIERLIPELQWLKYGKSVTMPKNNGDTISFRKFENIATSTTAITEGVIPTSAELVITKKSATVSEYGNWTKFTERINDLGLDPIVMEVTELMGENAGQSIDEIVRDIVTAGTNVQYANGVLSRATVADNISYVDIQKMKRTMKNNRVKKIAMPDGMQGYVCMVDPSVAMDITSLTEYKEFNQYQNSAKLLDGIVGKLCGIYFMEIDNGKVFEDAGAASADVHASVCLGRDAYVVPELEGKGANSPEVIVHKAGSAGTADPIDQFNTVGWKGCFTSLITQDLAVLRFESTATA